MYAIREEEGRLIKLPGRDWRLLIGPENMGAENLIFGICDVPVGSKLKPHSHAKEEEIIYVLQGEGIIAFPNQEVRLEPGVAIFIPKATEHWIESRGGQVLKFISLFSPPVVPGSYDNR
jgi:mannose-6-phosphate isomerase-like protein (cupin superfamily)